MENRSISMAVDVLMADLELAAMRPAMEVLDGRRE